MMLWITVTTPQYAPRLRERLKVECQLASDAGERGWGREVDRHKRMASRITACSANSANPAAQTMSADTTSCRPRARRLTSAGARVRLP